MHMETGMSVYIENEYNEIINIDYETIIISVVNEALDFIECPYECEVNVIIVDNEKIREINRQHRKIEAPTDVLSFPLLNYGQAGDFSAFEQCLECFHPDTGELMLGDIIISYDKVLSQAEEYNHSLKRELGFLTAHSMLHLFGFDHIEENERVEMEKMQNIILENLGITREN